MGGTTRHPWSDGFSWRTPPGPYRTLTEEQVARFDADGFVVLDAVLPLDLVAAVRDEIDAFEDETELFLRSADDERVFIAEAGAITFTTHLVRRSARLRDFVTHPVLVGLCHDLVGPDVRLYWDQAVYKKPEKPRRFPWHQDNGYTFVEPQQYLTCWIPLTDATEENGCPWVAPGVHRLGTLAHRYVEPLGFECFDAPPDGVEPVAAPVRAGGIVVFSSLTPHLTGPNTTGEVRKAYIVQYAPDGAATLRGDPPERTRCDDPDRQFVVLRGGEPVPG